MAFNRGSGRGSGNGMGRGNGRGQGRGSGRGRNSGPGPQGKCICPECGTTVAHQRGIPCYEQSCPKCGSKMIREDSSFGGNTLYSKNENATSNNNTPQIDKDKCTGCGQCVQTCPFNAISIEGGKAVIDPNLCRDCKKCVRACPVRAITP